MNCRAGQMGRQVPKELLMDRDHFRSDLRSSLYTCHPRPVNGYPDACPISNEYISLGDILNNGTSTLPVSKVSLYELVRKRPSHWSIVCFIVSRWPDSLQPILALTAVV